ncbi:hypothetical protein RHO14_10790 [Orbus wheelerorum]|uniref:hypothetical protein n=1 Tax=Orbus wheelerorum TaxID=3074111 RepID=UPI00370DCDF7
MKKRVIVYILIVISAIYFSNVSLAKLTNQQINLLLENDDIQIITPSSTAVKKSTLTIDKSTDNSQGKTIAEYDKQGLLINYYSAFATGHTLAEKRTMIMTLMRTENNTWRRKQTMGNYQIDNSIYVLKDDHFQVTLLPSHSFDETRMMLQKNEMLDNGKKLAAIFSYDKALSKEKINIEYQFNQAGLLSSFDYSNIDGNENGYTSIIQANFEYDDQLRLIGSRENSHYQFVNEASEDTHSQVTYSNFDLHGNWLTKTEKFDGEEVSYKRTIEYW